MNIQRKSIKDCCDILNIKVSDLNSEGEIRRAYHKLAIRWHPDKNMGSDRQECEAKFKDLAEAYDILMDPLKRSQAEYESKRREILSRGIVSVARTTRFDGSIFGGGAKFARQGTNPGLIHISHRERPDHRSPVSITRRAKEKHAKETENYEKLSERLLSTISSIYETVSSAVNGNDISMGLATSKLLEIKNNILGVTSLESEKVGGCFVSNSSSASKKVGGCFVSNSSSASEKADSCSVFNSSSVSGKVGGCFVSNLSSASEKVSSGFFSSLSSESRRTSSNFSSNLTSASEKVSNGFVSSLSSESRRTSSNFSSNLSSASEKASGGFVSRLSLESKKNLVNSNLDSLDEEFASTNLPSDSTNSDTEKGYLLSRNQNKPDYRMNMFGIPNYKTPNYIQQQTLCSGSDGPHMFGISGCVKINESKSKADDSNEHAFERIPVRHAHRKKIEEKVKIYPEESHKTREPEYKFVGSKLMR
ncbi:heat shock protein 40 [Cryptosporidium felis]|nr:heat shock protein 40 [Cryptosporidium felis]